MNMHPPNSQVTVCFYTCNICAAAVQSMVSEFCMMTDDHGQLMSSAAWPQDHCCQH